MIGSIPLLINVNIKIKIQFNFNYINNRELFNQSIGQLELCILKVRGVTVNPCPVQMTPLYYLVFNYCYSTVPFSKLILFSVKTNAMLTFLR